jgi:hypothetical protein
MLCAHPRIAIAPETHFLSHWVPRFRRLNVRGEEDFLRFWEAFCPSPHFQGLGVDADVARRRILISEPRDFRGIFQTLLGLYAQQRGKARWGEKTPTHYLHLETLLHWFPRARVLFLVRDPRAVVASRLRMPWRKRGVDDVACQWRDSIRILDAWGQDGRVQQVRYETLVREPEPALEAICAFLGEAFSAHMLHHGDAARSLVAGKPWSEGALLPVDAGQTGKWVGQLSPHQLAVAEYRTRRQMERLGYEPKGPPLSPLLIPALFLGQAVRALRRRLPGREARSI